MKKIRLTETDLKKIVERVVNEQDEFYTKPVTLKLVINKIEENMEDVKNLHKYEDEIREIAEQILYQYHTDLDYLLDNDSYGVKTLYNKILRKEGK